MPSSIHKISWWTAAGNVAAWGSRSASNFPERWKLEMCRALKLDPIGTDADVFALFTGVVELGPSVPQKREEPIGRGWALQMLGSVEDIAVDRQSPIRCDVYARVAAAI